MTGLGGVAGAGGATGVGGSTQSDGSSDAVEARAGDVALEGGPDVGLDVAADHGDGDMGVPDVPLDARDARDGRAGRDGRDASDVLRGEAGATLNLVWYDEFNAAANTGVDVSKWSYVTWLPGQVNNEKQQYTSNLTNVHHDGNGNLVLSGQYKPSATSSYTSGRIDTNGKVSFGPGHRIEVRAKLPAGAGSFPGIVMMGTSGTWPTCGQLSLMEQYGQDKSWFYSTVYAGSAAGSGSTDKIAYDFPDATTASTDFHVYSVDWYTDHVVFQVDGDEILSSAYATTSPLHNVTEYLILDVALGGDMGGTIDNTAFPMDMLVDYVRVYEL
jgi:beta-glucanase (GH16 family)